jgi:hypothetical protein
MQHLYQLFIEKLFGAKHRVKYFHGLPHLNLKTTLEDGRYYSHFTDEETRLRDGMCPIKFNFQIQMCLTQNTLRSL